MQLNLRILHVAVAVLRRRGAEVGAPRLGGRPEVAVRDAHGQTFLRLEGEDELGRRGSPVDAVRRAQAGVVEVLLVQGALYVADLGIASGHELVLVDAEDGLHLHSLGKTGHL